MGILRPYGYLSSCDEPVARPGNIADQIPTHLQVALHVALAEPANIAQPAPVRQEEVEAPQAQDHRDHYGRDLRVLELDEGRQRQVGKQPGDACTEHMSFTGYQQRHSLKDQRSARNTCSLSLRETSLHAPSIRRSLARLKAYHVHIQRSHLIDVLPFCTHLELAPHDTCRGAQEAATCTDQMAGVRAHWRKTCRRRPASRPRSARARCSGRCAAAAGAGRPTCTCAHQAPAWHLFQPVTPEGAESYTPPGRPIYAVASVVGTKHGNCKAPDQREVLGR